MQVFWHRRDLRTANNRGLAAAADAGDVVPVFCFDDVVLDHASPPRVAFMLDALAELRERYRDLGSDLVVRRGDPSAVLLDVDEEYDADRVVWNHDYSGLARERDERERLAPDYPNPIVDHGDCRKRAIRCSSGREARTKTSGRPASRRRRRRRR